VLGVSLGWSYPAKIWVNGHEWAKRQAAKAGIGFTELSNGFAPCDDPAGLQAICDRLQPGTIEVFAQRWLHRIPMLFGPADRDAGYWRECSMRQAEVSRTIVFDAPRRARWSFEALIGDNPGIGCPENVEIIFGRKIRRDTQGTLRTAVDRPVIGPDGGVVLNVCYKHSRIKEGRAMRIETVVNAPRDLGCNARLPNLEDLQARARAVNQRILQAERAGPGTVLASPAFDRRAPAEDPGPAVRRSPGHRPGGRARRHPHRGDRHQEQEPARHDDRAAARAIHPRPDDLRPAKAPPRRSHPADRAHQRLRSDSRRHQARVVHGRPQRSSPLAQRLPSRRQVPPESTGVRPRC
jgi:hypothetical protein